jgi:hypothetical protein
MDKKPTDYLIGLDLGQVNDYTAITIFERFYEQEPVIYHLRHVDRLKRGMSYPDQIAKVTKITNRAPLKGNCTLIIDGTGVGRPVVDMFRDARLSVPIKAVTITGGDSVNEDEKKENFKVPKRDLVGALQVLLQSKRLQVAEGMKNADILIQELLNFKVEVGIGGSNDKFQAWREGVHDDLVLSAAMAGWYGEFGPKNQGLTAFHTSPPLGGGMFEQLRGF